MDLAAENGGNCVKTVPGQLVEHNGVKIIGSSAHNSVFGIPIDQLQATRISHLDSQHNPQPYTPTTSLNSSSLWLQPTNPLASTSKTK